MAYFERFDICEAYLALEWDWHSGGILHERPSNARRNMSTDVQLSRMEFKPGAMFGGFNSLTLNAKEIYLEAAERFGLRLQCEQCDGAIELEDDGAEGRAQCVKCGLGYMEDGE
jgi:hypothetical protein